MKAPMAKGASKHLGILLLVLPLMNNANAGKGTTNSGEKVINMEQILQIVCKRELGKVNDQLMQ